MNPRRQTRKAVRDVLRAGPRTRQELRQAFPDEPAVNIRKAVERMILIGMITVEDGILRLSDTVPDEEYYSNYRTLPKKAPLKEDRPWIEPRSVEIDQVLRGW